MELRGYIGVEERRKSLIDTCPTIRETQTLKTRQSERPRHSKTHQSERERWGDHGPSLVGPHSPSQLSSSPQVRIIILFYFFQKNWQPDRPDSICSIFNTASSAATQVPLSRRMLGLNQGLVQYFYYCKTRNNYCIFTRYLQDISLNQVKAYSDIRFLWVC